jgi:Na+/melibiose symporter-like transporter
VRVVVLAALVAAILTGHVTVAITLVSLGLIATAEVFADNTASTLTPMLVSRDDLVVANSRLQAGLITLNRLVGPALGAAMFAAGRVWPFAAQAVLLAAGVLLVSRVVLPRHGREADASVRGVGRDLVEGIKWTFHHGAVRTLALTILVFNFTFGAAWSVLVVYADRRLGLGPVGYGMITSVSAAGGVLGMGVYGWLTRRVSLGNLMRAGLIIETLTHLTLALTTSSWVAFPVFFVFGAHEYVWGTTSITIRQRAVPIHLQGRVSSVNTICMFGGLVVGSAVGGLLASHFGVVSVFWYAFGGSALFVVLLWRELSRIAHADATEVTETS